MGMAPEGLRGGGGHPGPRMGASGSEPQEGQCGRLVGASLAGVTISWGTRKDLPCSCQARPEGVWTLTQRPWKPLSAMVRARERLSLDEALHDDGEEPHSRSGGGGRLGVSHKVCSLLKGSQIGVTLSKLGRPECHMVTCFCLGLWKS